MRSAIHWIIAVSTLFVLLPNASADPGFIKVEVDEEADRLFAFIMCDIHAKGIEESVRADKELVTDILKDVFETDDTPLKHRCHAVFIDLKQLRTPEAVLEFIGSSDSTFKITANDAILFYYSGHGGFDIKKGHFLATSVGSIAREHIASQLCQHSPRSIALITDSCASYAKFKPAKNDNLANWKTMRRLFFKPRGFIDIQSSSEGVYSLGTTEGGLFTVALRNQLCQPTDAPTQSWKEFFRSVRDETTRSFQLVQRIQPALQNERIQIPVANQLPDEKLPRQRYALHSLPQSGVGIPSIAISPDGSKVAAACGYNGYARVLDLQSGQQWRIGPPSTWTKSVTWSRDGKHVHWNASYWYPIESSAEWKPRAKSNFWKLGDPVNSIIETQLAAILQTDNGNIVIGGNNLSVWSLHREKPVRSFPVLAVDLAAISESQKELHCVDSNEKNNIVTLKTFSIENGDLVRSKALPAGMEGKLFSPNSRFLFAQNDVSGAGAVIDVETGKIVGEVAEAMNVTSLSNDGIKALALERHGIQLREESSVSLFDIPNRRRLFRLTNIEIEIGTLRSYPDAKLLPGDKQFVLSVGNEIRLYDLQE